MEENIKNLISEIETIKNFSIQSYLDNAMNSYKEALALIEASKIKENIEKNAEEDVNDIKHALDSYNEIIKKQVSSDGISSNYNYNEAIRRVRRVGIFLEAINDIYYSAGFKDKTLLEIEAKRLEVLLKKYDEDIPDNVKISDGVINFSEENIIEIKKTYLANLAAKTEFENKEFVYNRISELWNLLRKNDNKDDSDKPHGYDEYIPKSSVDTQKIVKIIAAVMVLIFIFFWVVIFISVARFSRI